MGWQDALWVRVLRVVCVMTVEATRHAMRGSMHGFVSWWQAEGQVRPCLAVYFALYQDPLIVTQAWGVRVLCVMSAWCHFHIVRCMW